MTSTALDLTVLEHLEFAPVCEYPDHFIYSHDDAPAEWLYVGLKPMNCGCVPPDRFFCTSCKIIRMGALTLSCSICNIRDQYNDLTSFRFEPIGGTP